MRKALVLILFVTGLIVSPALAAPVGQDDAHVQSLAAPVLDNLLAGMQEMDYAKYSRDFESVMAEAMTEEKFKSMQAQLNKSFGNCTGKTYLGFIDKGDMTMTLWKARFSATTDDVLIKLILTRRGPKVSVVGLWFE